MNEVWILTAVGAMTAALWVGGAAAGSEKPKPVPSRLLNGVFQPDPEGTWRTITPTDSTSDCIGDPVTPMCAIDTWVACYARNENKFCYVSSAFPELDIDFSPNLPPGFYKEYRVVSVHHAGAGDIDLLIGVLSRGCFRSNKACIGPIIPATYTVRQFGKRWLIVNIYKLH